MRIVKALLIWLLILGLAFLNGGLRELVLVPLMGLPYALLLSGAILSACVLAVAMATLPKIGSITTYETLGVGVFWLLLTLLFEFGFGRFVQHKPWEELLEAYTFAHGNVWPIVLLVIVFAPLIARRLRNAAPRN
jgi:hypothetical protein